MHSHPVMTDPGKRRIATDPGKRRIATDPGKRRIAKDLGKRIRNPWVRKNDAMITIPRGRWTGLGLTTVKARSAYRVFGMWNVEKGTSDTVITDAFINTRRVTGMDNRDRTVTVMVADRRRIVANRHRTVANRHHTASNRHKVENRRHAIMVTVAVLIMTMVMNGREQLSQRRHRAQPPRHRDHLPFPHREHLPHWNRRSQWPLLDRLARG